MPLNKEQQVIVDHIKQLMDLVPVIGTLERQLANNPTDLKFACNTTFVTRKCSELLNSMRKKLDELEEKVAKIAGEQLLKNNFPKYSTEIATISDNTTFYVKYPTKPDEPGYNEFMQQLTPELIRPHFPSIQKAFCDIYGSGGQIPWGLNAKDIKGVEYKLRLTAKREL